MSASTPKIESFRDLNLPAPLLQALDEVGYETPTPIQAEAIPYLLAGGDLLGHAPTGTGKTAAFALPLLTRIDMASRHIQVMTLTPTRELAIQVAEAFQRYASHLPDFHVLPVYGGQGYDTQLRQLKRGVQVVVGTPGRVMDHMRKGTLRLDGLQTLVLDEADEMLRMGFIEEVEWILEQAPKNRQMVLFSATMPKEVERIARRHLHDPHEISIKARTATAETIRQRYWLVSGVHKLDALTRILEVEPFDAILLFVRTKIATVELAERLEARGYSAAALNGDMAQNHREQMIARLKSGSLDILVATDVAARGLDVDRISHVINYDIPYDTEAYIHRIGRTGRAGRQGDAILFVAPRERRMLKAIERATRQTIDPFELPSPEAVNDRRVANFKQKITDAMEAGDLGFMQGVIEQYQQETDAPLLQIAAALSTMALGDRPLLMKPGSHKPPQHIEESSARSSSRDRSDERGSDRKLEKRPRKPKVPAPEEMERFRLEVGHDHGVEPGNIVGAIANEAGIDSSNIGHIEIFAEHSVVELPLGMPREIFSHLRKAWVCGKQLNLSRLDKPTSAAAAADGPDAATRKKHGGKKSRKPNQSNTTAESTKTDKKADAPRKKKVHRKGTGKPKTKTGSKRKVAKDK